MAFREVHVIEIREVLRLWLQGKGYRAIAEVGPVDRKTARRYVEAARRCGFDFERGDVQLTDDLIGMVVEAVRPRGPGIRGETWKFCKRHRQFLQEKVAEGLRLTKVRKLLQRHTGADVPYRTLHRFATEELGFGGKKTTVRVTDCDPGQELQVDFGRMGMVDWEGCGRKRTLWALIFTAAYSRHQFVWLTFRQTFDTVIEGFEEAWQFFGGVFHVVIPDNMKAVVDKADAVEPRINARFLEYSQSRGFVVDPTRVRRPKDKPRVERAVPYVREDFFKGEDFADMDDAQRRAVQWCKVDAGERTHGTTRLHPIEVFQTEETQRLLPCPDEPYDVPLWLDVKVGTDHHITVDYALYSLPTDYIGEKVTARADCKLVKIYHKGELVKTHVRQKRGGRSTDPQDYPEGAREYAMRDTLSLQEKAAAAGPFVGAYAARLVDDPRPWTKMRFCYRLLGLVRKYGDHRVDEACRRALELDVVDVARIGRMLERALETGGEPPRRSAQSQALPLRFARPTSDFQVAARHNNKEEDRDERE
jgi:transposase